MMRILAAILATALLGACNTMEGLGQDIERGGEKLQGAADKNRT
jgi:predicted small secreted protein